MVTGMQPLFSKCSFKAGLLSPGLAQWRRQVSSQIIMF
jgi:hypothetical protein